MILHGYSRTTVDLDVWVNKTANNYNKLVSAFRTFGLALFDMSEVNFLTNPLINVFSFGRPPVSIDILTEVTGLEFWSCHLKATLMDVDGISLRVIDIRDLKTAKRASGRPKDLDDLENLRDD